VRLRAGLAVLVLVVGCDDHLIGETTTEVVPGENVYSSDWTGVEQLFVEHCDGCHVEGGSGGFDLHEAIDAELNGGSAYYVVPSSAGDSVLWQVLSGTGAVAVMPPGGALQTELTAHVEEWINAGAPQ
jgi:hypothetical protein